MTIPTLTIRQPWAQLIICGAKDIENRDWPTRIRGKIAIHSSAKIDRREIESACNQMERWIPKFSRHAFTNEALGYPAGMILGTVEIVDCVRKSDSPWFIGEYGFMLSNPQPLQTPIPAKGSLGFWPFPLKQLEVK